MKRFNEKMYDYTVAPPTESWNVIATALSNGNNNRKPVAKVGRTFYKSLAAAAITIFFFNIFIWINNSKRENKIITASSLNAFGHGDDDQLPDLKITIPKTSDPDNTAGGVSNNKKVNTSIDETDVKKYITVCGPQGLPIKVSSKVASLIVSSDNQDPPNPVWNEKVKRWKNIMKANALAPTTSNFLDIVELTYAVTINDR